MTTALDRLAPSAQGDPLLAYVVATSRLLLRASFLLRASPRRCLAGLTTWLAWGRTIDSDCCAWLSEAQDVDVGTAGGGVEVEHRHLHTSLPLAHSLAPYNSFALTLAHPRTVAASPDMLPETIAAAASPATATCFTGLTRGTVSPCQAGE